MLIDPYNNKITNEKKNYNYKTLYQLSSVFLFTLIPMNIFYLTHN